MNSAAAPNITLRPVGPGDQDFLVQVYASTRAEEMAMVPWTDEERQLFVRSQFSAQQRHYAEKYTNANHDVILSNGGQVGRLYVARLEKEIRIVDLTLLPQERNKGIGSYLLQQLLEEARSGGKPTTIYVEEFNPSLNLFKRLGFNEQDKHGFHLLMEWTPAVT
jgi:GNAT superfamily N-acetyltransferase